MELWEKGLNTHHDLETFMNSLKMNWEDEVSVWRCGGEELRSAEHLLMQLSCPVTGRTTQSARAGRAQASITCTSLYFWGRWRQPSQIWSTNAVPLCHSYPRWRWCYVESDGDSAGRDSERHKEREKVEPPLILGFLKAKPLSPGEQWDNTLPYFNKERVLCNTLCTRSKSRAFICRRQSHINYQKNRIKK